MTLAARLVEATLERVLGMPVRISGRRRLGGGDICLTERIVTSAGAFVLKSGAIPGARMFRSEAEGLSALRQSGTSLVVPDVVACRDEEPAFLVLEDLGAGTPGAGFDDRVGRGLAELHRAGLALPAEWRRRSIYDHDHLVARFEQIAKVGDPVLAHAVAVLGEELAAASAAAALSAALRA